MQLNEESDFSKVTVKQEEGWSIEKVAQEASGCSQVPYIKPDIMEVDPLEEHYTECADDIKSAEFVEERSDKACEQPNIEEDAEDIKFINTQDYLDIGDTVVSEWNRAAPSVATALETNKVLKAEHFDPEDARILADEIKEIIFKKEERNTIMNPDGDIAGFIKEDHTDPDDAEIIAHEEKIRELILNKIEVRHGTTALKTEEEINADTRINVKTDVAAVASWRVILHRLPTDTLQLSTALSDIKQERMDIEEKSEELIMKNKEELHIEDDLEEAEIKYVNTQDYLDIGETVVGELNGAVRDVPTSSGHAADNDNKNENKQRKDSLEEGTNEFDEITAAYFVSNRTMRTANQAQKNKKNVTCHSGNLKTHLRTHTGEKPYKCETCDYKTDRTSRLKEHIRIHTGEKPYKCKMCDFKCTYSLGLKEHMQTHTGEKPYKCETCDYKCARSGTLKRHLRSHTGEKPYKCETCEFKSSYSSDLKKHVRRHTGEKPYKCVTCDYKCNRSDTLKIHMLTHSGEKPYKCVTCDYKCNRSDTLITHMLTHSGEKPYKCETCGFKCNLLNILKIHMRTHTGEKPYECETCDFKCARSGTLKRHLLSHTGEKPYKCETCNFKCKHSGSLKTHMLTHTGEKQYKSETCDYKSARTGHLKKHMRRHTVEKPYKCQTCDFKCTQSGHLKTHMLTHSGEKP